MHGLEGLHAVIREDAGGSAHRGKGSLSLRDFNTTRATEVRLFTAGGPIVHMSSEETINLFDSTGLGKQVLLRWHHPRQAGK